MHGSDLLRDILRVQHWTGKVETSLNAGVVDNGGIGLGVFLGSFRPLEANFECPFCNCVRSHVSHVDSFQPE